jgi:osmotically-inducible protein OsmY
MIKTPQRTLVSAAAAAALAALALTGCDRADNNARRDSSAAPSRGEQHADASRSMDRAGEQVAQAGRDMREAGRSAATEASNAVADAAITTSIKADLAKDPKLSALAIDVDTSGGQVVLHGTAPDAAAKSRATELAQGVHGVQSVDNQLTVAPARP